MEYLTFNINIVIGFICSILTLYGIQKEIIPSTGKIGMIFVLIEFILIFIYIVLNVLVFTTYYEDDIIMKTDSDGSYAKWDSSKKI